jgi:excisionase family DNA binding protein
VDQSDAPDTFLTVAEVAGILKLNQQTVRNWIDQGSLPALRVGRRVRIRRSDFERILAEGYTGGSIEPGATKAGSERSADAPTPADASTPAATTKRTGPTAEDFWGGEALGMAPAIDDPAAGNGNGNSA